MGSVPLNLPTDAAGGSHCLPREPKSRQASVPALQGTARPTKVHNPRFLKDKISLPTLAPASCSRTVGCYPYSCGGAGEWGMVADAH